MRGVVFAAVAGVVLLAGICRASLYSPDEPFAIPVGNDGKPVALPFDEFKRRLAVLTNVLIEPKLGDKPNPDRVKFLDRIRAHEKLPKPPAIDVAALAADLLRVGQADRALGLLGPLTAERKPDYFVFSTLGHLHAARGEWTDALRYHQEGQLDTKMPASVKGLTKAQRDWWEKLDAEYVPRFYQIRRQESDARRGLTPAEREKADEIEDVLPLFPLAGATGLTAPVRFVNDAGVYQPGTIAASEKAKLPLDAIAVVQQLLLWFPGETRLYWLLAELYAADGDVKSAVAILDECTWGRQYGNRKVLVAHRQALRTAADALPPVTAPEDTPLGQPGETTPAVPIEKPAISLETIGLYFGVVGVVAVLALLRTLFRRRSAA
ncbi:MAG: hypothetical protein C0467_11775 [Planctomycetaceae bacterium]|nr:hypothetical protein [Planctomycetaceae bacterium]